MVTDAEEVALIVKNSPGGIETLPETNRVSVADIRDQQLDRAQDLLKGLLVYRTLNASGK